MAHECNASGIVCKEQPDGTYLMTMSTGEHSAVNCMVNYCCHCGHAAPTPALPNFKPPTP